MLYTTMKFPHLKKKVVAGSKGIGCTIPAERYQLVEDCAHHKKMTPSSYLRFALYEALARDVQNLVERKEDDK